jgi:catechol 2,3-dioxygenase-like lactoylglutathione lyase family enzyme
MAEPPFALQGIDHIVLRVRTLAPALAFYCKVLGCRVEREQPQLGLTQLRAGRSLIDLVTLDGPLGRAVGSGTAPNLDHFCLAVAPFEPARLAQWLTAHGVKAEPPAERYGAAGEGPSVYIEDPEGNRIELKGAPAG